MQGEQQLLLFVCPRPVTEAWIQVVQVSLAALLAHSPRHVIGYLRGETKHSNGRASQLC